MSQYALGIFGLDISGLGGNTITYGTSFAFISNHENSEGSQRSAHCEE